MPPPRRKETAGPGYVVPIALAERVVGCKELLLPPSPDLGDEDPQEEGGLPRSPPPSQMAIAAI